MAGNGNSGRLRKPTNMKVLEDTYREDRANPNEPTPEPVQIGSPAPEWFEKEAKKEWDRTLPELIKVQVMTAADYSVFEQYCVEFGRWVRYEKEIQEQGDVLEIEERYKGKIMDDGEEIPGPVKRVMYVTNPKVRLRKEAGEQAAKLAAHFGLTPATRSKVSAVKQETKDDFDSL